MWELLLNSGVLYSYAQYWKWSLGYLTSVQKKVVLFVYTMCIESVWSCSDLDSISLVTIGHKAQSFLLSFLTFFCTLNKTITTLLLLVDIMFYPAHSPKVTVWAYHRAKTVSLVYFMLWIPCARSSVNKRMLCSSLQGLLHAMCDSFTWCILNIVYFCEILCQSREYH